MRGHFPSCGASRSRRPRINRRKGSRPSCFFPFGPQAGIRKKALSPFLKRACRRPEEGRRAFRAKDMRTRKALSNREPASKDARGWATERVVSNLGRGESSPWRPGALSAHPDRIRPHQSEESGATLWRSRCSTAEASQKETRIRASASNCSTRRVGAFYELYMFWLGVAFGPLKSLMISSANVLE